MKRILVVEDDVIICGGVKLFLEKMGYEDRKGCRQSGVCDHGVWNWIYIWRDIGRGR